MKSKKSVIVTRAQRPWQEIPPKRNDLAGLDCERLLYRRSTVWRARGRIERIQSPAIKSEKSLERVLKYGAARAGRNRGLKASFFGGLAGISPGYLIVTGGRPWRKCSCLKT